MGSAEPWSAAGGLFEVGARCLEVTGFALGFTERVENARRFRRRCGKGAPVREPVGVTRGGARRSDPAERQEYGDLNRDTRRTERAERSIAEPSDGERCEQQRLVQKPRREQLGGRHDLKERERGEARRQDPDEGRTRARVGRRAARGQGDGTREDQQRDPERGGCNVGGRERWGHDAPRCQERAEPVTPSTDSERDAIGERLRCEHGRHSAGERAAQRGVPQGAVDDDRDHGSRCADAALPDAARPPREQGQDSGDHQAVLLPEQR